MFKNTLYFYSAYLSGEKEDVNEVEGNRRIVVLSQQVMNTSSFSGRYHILSIYTTIYLVKSNLSYIRNPICRYRYTKCLRRGRRNNQNDAQITLPKRPCRGRFDMSSRNQEILASCLIALLLLPPNRKCNFSPFPLSQFHGGQLNHPNANHVFRD